jgi:hypothetical protein
VHRNRLRPSLALIHRLLEISPRALQRFIRLNANIVNRTRTSVGQLSSPLADFAVKLNPSSPRKRRQNLLLPFVCSYKLRRLGRAALPKMPYCSCYCRDNPLIQRDGGEQADVISLSSAGDSQRMWEGKDTPRLSLQGCSYLIAAFVGSGQTSTCVSTPSTLALPNHYSGNVPHPTLHKLRTYIRYVVH